MAGILLGALAALLTLAWVLLPVLRPTPEASTVERDGPVCPRCGPRPEADAIWCSTCGAPLG